MSSNESSDSEYRPDSEKSDINSDSETDYDEGGNKILKHGIKRRKQQLKLTSKRKSRLMINSGTSKIIDTQEQSVKSNEVEEKKRAEALWADFLNDTESTSSFVNTNDTKTSKETEIHEKEQFIDKNSKLLPKPELSTIENSSNVVDFTGEKVPVLLQNNDSSDKKLENQDSKLNADVTETSKRSGLSSILHKLHKKNTISTLEKSKLDWQNFKKQENLDKELQIFNKGKNGFLERQDFLERTDERQFEIEKKMRQTKRGARHT